MKKTSDDVLKRFMKEHFPYGQFRKAGIFKKEMRGDYQAQADHICRLLGYKTIYEYRNKEIRCHITYAGSDPAGLGSERPLHIDGNGKINEEPFVSIVPSIYE